MEATIREMIEGVLYSPGDQIPSERELSEQLGISRMTVRRAVENLIRRGVLERHSTNGTYVSRPQVLRRVGKDFALGLTQLLQDEGVSPGSRLLSFQISPAPLKIAEKLDLRLGSPVICYSPGTHSERYSFLCGDQLFARELASGTFSRGFCKQYIVI